MKSFLQDVAADLITRFGDDLKDVAIVFNNKRPVLFLKKHLGEQMGKSSWSPSFFTIGEFFSKSSSLVQADAIRQFFILNKEFNKLLTAEGKPVLTPDQFYPVAEIILNDFAQIDYDLVNAKDLFCELEDLAVLENQFPHFTEEQHAFLEQFLSSFSADRQQEHQQKFIDLWKRMPKLYEAFQQELKDQGLITSAQIYRQLAEGTASNCQFTDPFKKLVFIGFNALNRCESKLFKKWQEEDKALFYFDTDPYYLEDELQEAGLFLRRNFNVTGLKNSTPVATAMAEQDKCIKVVATQGYASQAKALSEIISSSGYVQTDEPEQAAIIIADESLLVPVLQTIPSDAGKVNVTMGFPLAQSTVFGLIELWLHVQEQVYKGNKDTIYYRDVEAFLSHPLTAVPERERELLQQRMLENQWQEIPLSELLFCSVLAPNFFTIKHEGLQTIDGLYLLLTAVLEQRQKNGRLQQLEANQIVGVCKNLNQLHDGLAEFASDLPLPFVLKLIRKALQGLSVPLEGEPLRGIQVMGLLESRCLDFERVILLGINEGIVPKLTLSPTFIPDSMRRVHSMPVLENQDAISAYLFYRLLQRSSEVTIVYNTIMDDSNSGEASRFLRQLEFESNFQFKYYKQKQVVKVEPKRPLLIAKEGKVWNSLQRFLKPEGKDAGRLSATALTTFLDCSLQFFFKYVAKIEEPKQISENVEPNQVGSVLHQVMEWFYQGLVQESRLITAERIRNKLNEIPSLCKQALSQELTNHRDRLKHPNSMHTIVLRIVEEYVKVILDHDIETAPFEIIELENKSDYKYSFPLMVKGRLQNANLFGIIDRVDRWKGITRIVDYKTGGRDEVKFSSLDDVFERDGRKHNKALIQTLFYTFIYEQVKDVDSVEPNLYIVRKMSKDGTRFMTGARNNKVELQAEHLESLKSDFTGKLKQLLEELFDPEKPFIETANREGYTYCPYKLMCQR